MSNAKKKTDNSPSKEPTAKVAEFDDELEAIDDASAEEAVDTADDADLGDDADTAAEDDEAVAGKKPAKKSAKKSKDGDDDETDEESDAKRPLTRRERRQANKAVRVGNPQWFVPVMLTFFIVGLAWIVVFYLTQLEYPIPGIQEWNLVIGFALLMVGFGMTTRWK